MQLTGEIFKPLIPGAILAGLCAGFASLITILAPAYTETPLLYLLYQILNIINISFLTYMTAWVGYSAADRFGATPILGGMLGLITILPEINDISKTLLLYKEDVPQQSVLSSGSGGVIAVILGVYVLAHVERFLRARLGKTANAILTPLLTMLLCTTLYLLVVMPAAGYVSSVLCRGIEVFCMSDVAAVRIAAGAITAALFLPLVALGMHLGLSAIYVTQLNESGSISLYPALAMAGAGQVGAAIAIYQIAKENERLRNVIRSAVIPGICGIGQPLIFGVTLPLGKPFFYAGVGAIFGGAYVTAMEVAAINWGPSGLLAVFLMTTPSGPVWGMLHYLIGLLISCIMGFVITKITLRPEDITI